jgi:hypothetical protein
VRLGAILSAERFGGLRDELDALLPVEAPEQPDEDEQRLEEIRAEARYYLRLPNDAPLEEIQAEFAKGLRDFWIFFFPHYREREDGTSTVVPAFHDSFIDEIEQLVLERRRKQLAKAYPREHAKSVIASMAAPIWVTAHALRRFPVILSDTGPQAAGFLEDIRDEVDTNERLQAIYPEYCTWGAKPRVGTGGGRLVFGNETLIMAAGSGKSVRGMRRRAQRPDFIVVDDIENDEEVENPRRRAKKMRWFNRSIRKLGKGALFLIVGTILHADSFLANQVESKRDINRAVVEYPAQMDLWQEWEKIFHDRSRSDRKEAARGFYEAHRAEMDAGAVVLWPEMYTLYQLMVERAEDLASFLSERQNDPFDPAASYFPEESLAFLEDDDKPGLEQVRLSVGFWDPSRGTSKSDTSAAFRLDVLHDGRRFVSWGVAGQIPPEEIIETLVGAHKIRAFYRVGVEKVGLSNYDGDLQRVSRQAGITLPVEPVTPQGEKQLRIKSMRPIVVSGGLLFAADLPLEAIRQIKYYGQHPNDDVWDAIQPANTLADEFLQDVKPASASREPEPESEMERPSLWNRPSGLLMGLGERIGQIGRAWS